MRDGTSVVQLDADTLAYLAEAGSDEEEQQNMPGPAQNFPRRGLIVKIAGNHKEHRHCEPGQTINKAAQSAGKACVDAHHKQGRNEFA